MNPYLPDASDPRMAGVKPLPEGLRPVSRPRRLRTTPAMRRMVAETRVVPAQLILPAFVKGGSIPPSRSPACPANFSTPPSRLKSSPPKLPRPVSVVLTCLVSRNIKTRSVLRPGTRKASSTPASLLCARPSATIW
ncbi:porphobilinogen synthase [Cutibacterium acnes HL001PA1]|nr:porphobilinogen synthase [Cutibacterium acnes HL001PA1]